MARYKRDNAELIREVVGTIGRGTGKPFETTFGQTERFRFGFCRMLACSQFYRVKILRPADKPSKGTSSLQGLIRCRIFSPESFLRLC